MDKVYLYQALGELLGTFILVLLGNGVCFSVNHRKMFANQPGKWIAITIGWAIAVFCGAMAASAIGAPGHLNPAVTVFSAFSDVKCLLFIPFQFIGAMLAQVVLYLINWNFIKDEANSVEGDKSATRGATCTNPAFDGKKAYATNFAYEFVATGILLMILFIMGLGSEEENVLKPSTTPGVIAIVSITVLAIGMSLGSATGFAINPARDLGPRVIYQGLRMMKTGKSLVSANWQYSWIPVCAPLLAGLFFGLVSLSQ